MRGQGQGADSAVATRLARRAVEAAAPQELAQFAMTAEAFHRAAPHRRLPFGGRDEPLGLGVEAVAALLSTAALAAAVQVLEHLAQQSTERAVDTVRRRAFPRLRRRRPEVTATVAVPERLSSEQLAQVRQIAMRTAARLRVPEAQAWTIADGIVAELATVAPDAAPPGESEEGTPEAGQ
ncbi:hypothetical protein ACIO6T_29090 [Streptomyces sp. NPDC087532]|uniref:hypothetical protein n=2 Tax=Streptomyces TaxID=1883 RepID=UPI003414C19C